MVAALTLVRSVITSSAGDCSVTGADCQGEAWIIETPGARRNEGNGASGCIRASRLSQVGSVRQTAPRARCLLRLPSSRAPLSETRPGDSDGTHDDSRSRAGVTSHQLNAASATLPATSTQRCRSAERGSIRHGRGKCNWPRRSKPWRRACRLRLKCVGCVPRGERRTRLNRPGGRHARCAGILVAQGEASRLAERPQALIVTRHSS